MDLALTVKKLLPETDRRIAAMGAIIRNISAVTRGAKAIRKAPRRCRALTVSFDKVHVTALLFVSVKHLTNKSAIGGVARRPFFP